MSTSILRRKRQFCIAPQLDWMEDRVTPAIYTVTNPFDSGLGSLRQAVLDANSTPVADTIVFAASLNNKTITLNSQLNVSGSNLTIAGPGSGVLAISGGNANRLFSVQNASLTINDLTLENGLADNGGAVSVGSGTLNLNRDVLVNNHATNGGGAVYSQGTLNANNDSFFNNSADGIGGGAILNNAGRIQATNNWFVGNKALSGVGVGGAVLSGGGAATGFVNQSTFIGNSALLGGAVGVDWGAHLTLNQDYVASNNAVQAGGALFESDADSNATVSNSTFLANTAGIAGGAFYLNGPLHFSLTNSTVSYNSAHSGGGVYAQAGTFNPATDLIQFNYPDDIVLV